MDSESTQPRGRGDNPTVGRGHSGPYCARPSPNLPDPPPRPLHQLHHTSRERVWCRCIGATRGGRTTITRCNLVQLVQMMHSARHREGSRPTSPASPNHPSAAISS